MHYLYGSKPGVPKKLVATFGSEQQLLAYVRWATLAEHDKECKFEQGSALASYRGWSQADHHQAEEEASSVPHNPSPNML
ncbi:MAG: hypothetical protein JSS27_03570 [Planctomycetes bacterium]|nr:hypothetical protein [Planctomycetota bacterium]